VSITVSQSEQPVFGQPLTRTWMPDGPLDLRRTLSPLRRGAGDPAHQVDADGTFWWACLTPQGPGTLALAASSTGVLARAWGPGAAWLIDGVPELLGSTDDWSALDCRAYPGLADVHHRNPGLRLPRTRLVLDALVPAILEQRVTGGEARSAWRHLLYKFGTPAPGPVGDKMRVPPDAATLLSVPSWDWHRMGVDLQRVRAIRAAATVASRLEECVGFDIAAAGRRLQVLPGIGVWTAAETTQRALGDPDSISIGDYHVHDIVVHALTGRARGDDAEMVALLEPWRGHRQRVVRLIELSGVRKPRFGPRYSPLDTRAM
jgi:3-methyladenine DNA glycosylase/8-oxoguanine DNA glycosylase